VPPYGLAYLTRLLPYMWPDDGDVKQKGRDAPKDALDLQLSTSQELLTRIRILVTIASSSARSRGPLGREACMTLNKWEPGSFRLPGVRPGSVFAPDGGT